MYMFFFSNSGWSFFTKGLDMLDVWMLQFEQWKCWKLNLSLWLAYTRIHLTSGMLNRWLHNVNASSTFVGKSRLPCLTFGFCSTGARFKAYIKSLKSCDLQVPIEKNLLQDQYITTVSAKQTVQQPFCWIAWINFVWCFSTEAPQVGSNSAERSFFPQDWSGKCWKWYGLKMHKLYLAVQCSLWK